MADDNPNIPNQPNEDLLDLTRDLVKELSKLFKLREKELDNLKRQRGIETDIQKMLKERVSKLSKSNLDFSKDVSKNLKDGAKEAFGLNSELRSINSNVSLLNKFTLGKLFLDGIQYLKQFSHFFKDSTQELFYDSPVQALKNLSSFFEAFNLKRKLGKAGEGMSIADLIPETQSFKQHEALSEKLYQMRKGKKLAEFHQYGEMIKELESVHPNILSSARSGGINDIRRVLGGLGGNIDQLRSKQSAIFKDLVAGPGLLQRIQLGATRAFGVAKIEGGAWLGILGGGVSRLVALMGGPVTVAIALIIGGLVKMFHWFNQIDESADNFRKSMGLIKGQANSVEAAAFGTYVQFRALGVQVDDFYKSVTAIADVMGTAQGNRGVASSITLVAVQLGVAQKTTAEFLKSLAMVQTTSLAVQQNTLLTSIALANANLVPLDTLMKDVSAAAKSSYSFLSRSATSLVKSAVSARLMGTNLQETAKTAKSILNFTSSVQDEMEASVLIGQNLNLQYARELAYRKDIQGLNAEILRIAQETNFEQLDPFQQEAVAKALGKTSDEVASILQAEKERFKLSKGLTAEDVKKKLLNESMRSSWQSIKDSVTSIFVDTLAPLLPAFAITLKATAYVLEKVAAAFKVISPYLNTFGGILGLLSPGGGLSSLSGISKLFSPEAFLNVAPNVTPNFQVEPFKGPETAEFHNYRKGSAGGDSASQKRHEEMLASNEAVVGAINKQTEAFMKGGIPANVQLDSQLLSSATDRATRFKNGYGVNNPRIT